MQYLAMLLLLLLPNLDFQLGAPQGESLNKASAQQACVSNLFCVAPDRLPLAAGFECSSPERNGPHCGFVHQLCRQANPEEGIPMSVYLGTGVVVD